MQAYIKESAIKMERSFQDATMVYRDLLNRMSEDDELRQLLVQDSVDVDSIFAQIRGVLDKVEDIYKTDGLLHQAAASTSDIWKPDAKTIALWVDQKVTGPGESMAFEENITKSAEKKSAKRKAKGTWVEPVKHSMRTRGTLATSNTDGTDFKDAPLDEGDNRYDDNDFLRTPDDQYVNKDTRKRSDRQGRALAENDQRVDDKGTPMNVDPDTIDELDRDEQFDKEGDDADDRPTKFRKLGEESEESEWGYSAGGSEEREFFATLAHSEVFEETEMKGDKSFVKRPLRPEAVRDASGKLARMRPVEGEQADAIESQARGEAVKTDEYGAPYEDFEEVVRPYSASTASLGREPIHLGGRRE
ncbi:hypothetical protein HKX48_000881 [Thoreauomyces humboldtii]|nr:hypothetical protein HKX48_000881 [Thoreauomyces humboldtii]